MKWRKMLGSRWEWSHYSSHGYNRCCLFKSAEPTCTLISYCLGMNLFFSFLAWRDGNPSTSLKEALPRWSSRNGHNVKWKDRECDNEGRRYFIRVAAFNPQISLVIEVSNCVVNGSECITGSEKIFLAFFGRWNCINYHLRYFLSARLLLREVDYFWRDDAVCT